MAFVAAAVFFLGVSFAMARESAANAKIEHDRDAEDHAPSVFTEITFSTFLWDWAPWLKSLVAELENNWSLSTKSEKTESKGFVVVEFSVSTKGVLRERKLIESGGAEPVVAALWACIDTIAVQFPLPEHFPDESLNVVMRLDFPPLQ